MSKTNKTKKATRKIVVQKGKVRPAGKATAKKKATVSAFFEFEGKKYRRAKKIKSEAHMAKFYGAMKDDFTEGESTTEVIYNTESSRRHMLNLGAHIEDLKSAKTHVINQRDQFEVKCADYQTMLAEERVKVKEEKENVKAAKSSRLRWRLIAFIAVVLIFVV